MSGKERILPKIVQICWSLLSNARNILEYLRLNVTRLEEVARKQTAEKTQTQIWSPNIPYFVAILRFVAIYALFGRLLAKKVLFWVKSSVSWARSALLHCIYCILYWTKCANFQLRGKTTHLLQISKDASDERIEGIFCVCRKPGNFLPPWMWQMMNNVWTKELVRQMGGFGQL